MYMNLGNKMDTVVFLGGFVAKLRQKLRQTFCQYRDTVGPLQDLPMGEEKFRLSSKQRLQIF